MRKNKFETSSHVEIKELYSGKDLVDLPGKFPYTLGIYPTMYRERLWTMRQYAGFGTAAESNKRYKYLLEHGQSGLSVAFDLPTQMGYDSDNPLCQDEVGKAGVAIDSLLDMEVLFKGIPLDKVSTSMTINATAAILLCCYIAVAEKQGVTVKDLRGTVQNDILKEYIARGTYIYPPKQSLKIICDIFDYCKDHLPKWNTISISGYHIREAGSSAVQEVAFTLSNAITYVESALKTGLKIDEFAPQLSFFFNCHNGFLEEIAKFRAARRLWAKLMKERFSAKDERSWMLRFHTQTGGSTLTAQQADNNIVRVALQALAAVLGGTQSLHTNSKDEALSLPSDHAVKLALRTQQVVAYESGVADFVDPLGGSYALEALTDEIEKKVLKYIEDIEKMGGAISAIERGFQQSEIQKESYLYQKQLEEKKQCVVGVNIFQEKEKHSGKIHKVDEKSVKQQIKNLKKIKKERDAQEVKKKLEILKEAATQNKNVVPPILDAVRVYATIGEISDVLRWIFGEYKPTF